jgi:hypothetical protein
MALDSVARQLVMECSEKDEGWGRHVAYLRRFGADFLSWDLADLRETYNRDVAQARAAGREPGELAQFLADRYGHLPQFRQAAIPPYQASSLTPELLQEWWRIVSDRGFQIAAIRAFAAVWDRSYRQTLQDKRLSEEIRSNLVPWERVSQFLADLGYEPG